MSAVENDPHLNLDVRATRLEIVHHLHNANGHFVRLGASGKAAICAQRMASIDEQSAGWTAQLGRDADLQGRRP